MAEQNNENDWAETFRAVIGQIVQEEMAKEKMPEEMLTESVSEDTSHEESDDRKGDEPASESQSDGKKNENTKQPTNETNENDKNTEQPQRKFKVVGQNDNRSPFTSSGEFTEEQLVKMYRQMQADRARTQQLLSHVTSPYTMHGSAGESAAMAAGAFVGFALGRTMYKASRIGHLRQDWRLRREVLRQERGYYNQGAQGRFGGILNGFSNAASSFVQGWRRGTRKDIDMDVHQPAEKVVVKALEAPTENEPTAEPNCGIA